MRQSAIRGADCRATTFKQSFALQTGQTFTPQNFREHRLELLDHADAVINIRVGMSESSAFELAYHIFKGSCAPILFLVWKHALIKTTLLRELQDLCDVTYLEFDRVEDLKQGIQEFFTSRRFTRRKLPAIANAKRGNPAAGKSVKS